MVTREDFLATLVFSISVVLMALFLSTKSVILAFLIVLLTIVQLVVSVRRQYESG